MRELLRPAYFVPESVRTDVLFRDMQSKKVHLSIVVDEYGGTSGLVTLEDLRDILLAITDDEFYISFNIFYHLPSPFFTHAERRYSCHVGKDMC